MPAASTVTAESADGADTGEHSTPARLYSWQLTGLAACQMLLGAVFFTGGVTLMVPPEHLGSDESRFWAVLAKPSIAAGSSLQRSIGGLAVSVVGGAAFVNGCASLAVLRDLYLTPKLNRFWAPASLMACTRLPARTLVLSSRGRTVAVALVIVLIAWLCYVPKTRLFDGNPELSKQFGTAAGARQARCTILS